jgi:pimeloyl-ACP methyl ester carboxylesterase
VISTERRVALGDGAETTLEQWGERGPLILAVLGMTSSRKAWQRLAEHWSGRFRVAAYDQRGHGDSAAVTGPMALARGVQDALEVAATLDEQPVALLGHSWGGAVSILAGMRLPVQRVATIDPMLHQASREWYDEYVVELREQFALHGEERDTATRTAAADWHAIDVEGKVHAMHAMTAEPIERLFRENPPLVWDVRPALSDYPKPLLLLLAAPNEGINDAAVVEAVRRDRSPAVEIVEVPGAGHNLHRTDFPAVVRELERFL